VEREGLRVPARVEREGLRVPARVEREGLRVPARVKRGATSKPARTWARPPCGHFMVQSCCCLGVCFRGGGFPNPSPRLEVRAEAIAITGNLNSSPWGRTGCRWLRTMWCVRRSRHVSHLAPQTPPRVSSHCSPRGEAPANRPIQTNPFLRCTRRLRRQRLSVFRYDVWATPSRR
jgi:hypothetical protein